MKFRSYPNNFLYSGYYSISSFVSRGYYGRYWSSTAANSNSSYSMDIRSDLVHPGTNNNYKGNGYSVRCMTD